MAVKAAIVINQSIVVFACRHARGGGAWGWSLDHLRASIDPPMIGGGHPQGWGASPHIHVWVFFGGTTCFL
jgi:hypothetical protein